MEPIQLSDELIQTLLQSITQHDERAADPGVAVQYMAATIGYMIGQQQFSMEDKKEFLNQLYGFSSHVIEDITAEDEENAAGQDSTGQDSATEEAVGIWKPGDK